VRNIYDVRRRKATTWAAERFSKRAIKNRDADIFRTADALARIERAKYIREKIGPTAKFFVRALVTANASDMSDSAFRQLFTFLTFGNDDGTSIFPSHDTVAAIMGHSVRTSERATAELTERGRLQTKQARRGPAIRAVVIPNEKMVAITDEILEPSKLAVLNGSARPLNRQNWQSKRHLEHPGHGCPVAGAGTDAGRFHGAYSEEFIAGTEKLIQRLSAAEGGIAAASERARAIRRLLTLVGAVVTARAVGSAACIDEFTGHAPEKG
jgi:hypothetical protein